MVFGLRKGWSSLNNTHVHTEKQQQGLLPFTSEEAADGRAKRMAIEDMSLDQFDDADDSDDDDRCVIISRLYSPFILSSLTLHLPRALS